MLTFNKLGKSGRLGNQMFQYAALRGIAANNGYDWAIPRPGTSGVDEFGTENNYCMFETFKLESATEDHWGLSTVSKWVVWKEFHFNKQLFDGCPNDVNLDGYFQSEKYFKNIEEEIRDDFTFRQEIRSECDELVEDAFEEPIALHIRRGDFLKNSGNHHNLGLDYYKKAISKFDDDRNIIVFSDDPNWCKEQDIFSSDRFLISENTDNRIDLCLMSMCSDFIIANSTFSWWGAWLADCGRVIAPTQWFGPANQHKDLKDLYPKHWELI